VVHRVVAVALATFSLLLIWAECTIWTTQMAHTSDLSPFSAVVAAATSEAALHLAVMLPLAGGGAVCYAAHGPAV